MPPCAVYFFPKLVLLSQGKVAQLGHSFPLSSPSPQQLSPNFSEICYSRSPQKGLRYLLGKRVLVSKGSGALGALPKGRGLDLPRTGAF